MTLRVRLTKARLLAWMAEEPNGERGIMAREILEWRSSPKAQSCINPYAKGVTDISASEPWPEPSSHVSAVAAGRLREIAELGESGGYHSPKAASQKETFQMARGLAREKAPVAEKACSETPVSDDRLRTLLDLLPYDYEMLEPEYVPSNEEVMSIVLELMVRRAGETSHLTYADLSRRLKVIAVEISAGGDWKTALDIDIVASKLAMLDEPVR